MGRPMIKNLLRRKPQPEAGDWAAERAGLLFDSGLNCAQSVLQAATGIDDPGLMDICEAFGGGIGGQQCLCGAISGGVMALGLKGKKHRSGDLVEQFKQRHKVTCCKGLTAAYRLSGRERLAHCRGLTVTTAADVIALIEG
jgi:C_GCAxxG_C_C family probable redox protein